MERHPEHRQELAALVAEFFTLKQQDAVQELVLLSNQSLLTTSQVAQLLDVSVPTVRRLVERGELSAVQVGTHLRFAPGALKRYQELRAERSQLMDEMVSLSRELEDMGIE